MRLPKKGKANKGQQIVLPDEIVGKYGRLVAVKDNEDGSKSLYFAYTSLELPDDSFDYLKRAVAGVNVFNRYNPAYQAYYEQYYTSSQTPYSTAIVVPSDPHERMKLCREICILEPVVGTAVDILVDISHSGFRIEDTGNKKIDEFYKQFNEDVDMFTVLGWIFQEYYLSSNVVVYKELDDEGIPVGYTVLNPLKVKIEGPLLFNSEVVMVDISDSELVTGDSEIKERFMSLLPVEWQRAIEEGRHWIPLPPEKVSRITRRRQPYDRYATPFLTRLIQPVLYKQRLRLMDLSTIEGVINQLLVVTVGDKDRPPTDKTLKQVAELFLTPKKSFTIFWDYTLKVDVVAPNAIETLYQDKFKEVDEDISKGLGVPRALIDGVGANYAAAFVGVQMLIERAAREAGAVKRWLEKEYATIAKIKGFKTYPKVKFDRAQLRPDNYIRQILMPLYEKGLLSRETMLIEAGFDYGAELERKKREVSDEQFFMPPPLPYSRPAGRPSGSPSSDYQREEPVTTPDAGPSEISELERQSTLAARKTSERNDFLEEQIENYRYVFTEHYDNLLENIKQIYSRTDLDSVEVLNLVDSVFKAFVMASYEDTFKFIEQAVLYGNEGHNLDNLVAMQYWHKQALEKFASDLKYALKDVFSSGEKVVDKITEIFDRNRYRVDLFAVEGVLQGLRAGEVAKMRSDGVGEVRWRTMGDDRVCAVCASREGQVYPINAVPARPHVRCRCYLEPVTFLV